MQKKISIILLGYSLLVTGCAHKIDIQQGNVVSQVQLDKVRLGMERRQVAFVLGTPLLADPFHQDRWDYYYSFKPGGGEVRSYRVTLWFENDRLAKLDKHGELPAERPLLDRSYETRAR